MSDWPRFQSHRVVQATPIVRIERLGAESLPLLFVDPSDGRERDEPFFPTEPNMAKRAQIGDYAMRYEDGYLSLCPRAAFIDAYDPVNA